MVRLWYPVRLQWTRLSVDSWPPQDENLSLSLKELLQTPRGRLELAAHALAIVGMTPFLLLEMGTIPAYGIFGWLDAWNVLDICTYTIQVGAGVWRRRRLLVLGGTGGALGCGFLSGTPVWSWQPAVVWAVQPAAVYISQCRYPCIY